MDYKKMIFDLLEKVQSEGLGMVCALLGHFPAFTK